MATDVTSNEQTTILTLDPNTIFAASGSTYILNSAAGVWFPLPDDPPIKTISSIFSLTSG